MTTADKVVFVGIGALMGATTAWYFTKKHYIEKFDAELDNQVAALRESYGRHAREDLKEKLTEESEEAEEETPEPDVVVKKIVVEEGYAPKANTTFGQVTYPHSPQILDVTMGSDYSVEDVTIAPHDETRPYLISYDEYMGDEEDENEQMIDKQNLMYFKYDDTLCNEAEEVISPAALEEAIGRSNLDWFLAKDIPQLQDFYVRCPKTNTDYVVTLEDNSYQIACLGLEIDLNMYKREYEVRRQKLVKALGS